MLLCARFVPLGRPGFVFRPRLKRERGRPDRQAAESSYEAENLQDHPDKIQQYAIHRTCKITPVRSNTNPSIEDTPFRYLDSEMDVKRVCHPPRLAGSCFLV